MLNSRLILFVLVLSAFALWFDFQQNTYTDTLGPSTLQSTDYSWQLFNSTTWQFNKELNQHGSIIKANTLFYDEAAKTSDFTEPRITLIEASQTLFIESQSGHSINNNNFELSGQVAITQFEQPIKKLDQALQNKTLTTEHITYNSKTEKISSDQEVTITQPNSILVGTGLEVDLKTNQFHLLSSVKGEYNPIKALD